MKLRFDANLEISRIEKLCEWGKPLGVDGFVRMEFHLYVLYLKEQGTRLYL